MIFKCTCGCGERASIAEADIPFFESLGWQRLQCYSAIVRGNYAPKNETDGVAVFSPMGKGLGDRVLWSAVKWQYMKDNPFERVVACDSWDEYKRYLEKPPRAVTKYFLSDVRPKCEEVLQPLEFRQRYLPKKNGYWFRLVNEANRLAAEGRYQPRLWFAPEGLPDGFWKQVGEDRTIVLLHLRNVEKCVGKNVTLGEAMRMLAMLRNAWEAEPFTTVVIGNDLTTGMKLDPMRRALRLNPEMQIIDMRNKLTLGQIRRLMGFSDLFVGKDSGIAHVVATQVRSLVFGFKDMAWAPKGPAPVAAFAEGDETAFLAKVPETWIEIMMEPAEPAEADTGNSHYERVGYAMGVSDG